MPGIKTLSRNAIGSHLTYPLRLSTIQKELGPAKDRFSIGVRFWDYKAARPGELRDRHPIIDVEFDPSAPDERYIRVSPIPKVVNTRIHERVIALLSQNAGPWLLAKRNAGWHDRFHALRISFDAKTDTFDMHEHNEA